MVESCTFLTGTVLMRDVIRKLNIGLTVFQKNDRFWVFKLARNPCDVFNLFNCVTLVEKKRKKKGRLSPRTDNVRIHLTNCFFSKRQIISKTSKISRYSILGLILFLCFINDIISCIPFSEFLLYANDFKLFKPCRARFFCRKTIWRKQKSNKCSRTSSH